MRTLTILFWILGFLPLAIYPFVELGDTIGLSMIKETPRDVLGLIAVSFMWTSFVYPLVYFGLLIASVIAAVRRSWKWAMRLAGLSILYLLVVLMLFGLWLEIGAGENRIVRAGPGFHGLV